METTLTSTRESAKPTAAKAGALLYIFLTAGAFAVIAFVFLFFPRSTYSELEKRELATPPDFTLDRLLSSEYASDLSHWFNDSEPYRDLLMGVSMKTRDAMRLSVGGEEAISFHAADPADSAAPDPSAAAADPSAAAADEFADVPEYQAPDGVSKIAHSGIVVLGTAPNARALMAYGGVKGGDRLVSTAKRYAAELPGVNIYTMVAPIATEFYLPEKAKSASKPQITTIENIKANVGPTVKNVDVYNALKAHAAEDIYLRTDHHWAPLGAYYAAQQLAKTAGVPFRSLDNGYERKVVRGYVGTMYGYSKDMAVKNSPEDFVYYKPTQVSYTTTFRIYKTDSHYKVIGEGAPFKSEFFKSFKDGSGAAYCTFMGGDQLLAKVETGTKNGRRLVIIKDSYGNPVPSFLFYSFEEIHVVDFRYFSHNMKKYCAENRITDLAFMFNIYNAYSGSAAVACDRFLTQGDNTFTSPAAIPGLGKPDKAKADSSKSTPADGKQHSPVPPEAEPAPAPEAEPATAPQPAAPAVEPEPAPAPAPAPEPAPAAEE